MERLIGTVSGLQEITPFAFWVRVNTGSTFLGLDDVIKVEYRHNGCPFRVFGVITEVVTRWDGTITSGYQEEAFAEGIYEGTAIYLAHVVVTRVFAEVEGSWLTVPPALPPPVGQGVCRAEPGESDIALGYDRIRASSREVPAGVLSGGAPAYFDLRYLLGDNGAHVNVSGQSGVAAKTSYATFLLWMMKEYGGKVLKDSLLARSRSIVFNVKGESLLFLDHWNKDWLDARNTVEGEGRRNIREWEDMFRACGVEPHPFEQVSVYVAPRDERGTLRISRQRRGVAAYGWDVLDIAEYGLLPLMFDPEELAANVNFQLAVVVMEDLLRDNYERLAREARQELNSGSYRDFRISPDGLDQKTLVLSYLKASRQDPEVILTNFSLPNDFDALLRMLRVDPSGGEGGGDEGELIKVLRKELLGEATLLAVSRRLRTARRTGLNLLWRRIEFSQTIVDRPPVPSYNLDWNRPGGVTVVDVSKLSVRAQAFVVGAVLRDIMLRKESEALEEPVFVFLDELNKYAPRNGGGPLGSIFRDVAERGRSFGVVLVGAEQTASQVDYRVITQAATTVVGRQKHAELNRDEYAHLSGALREKASALLPGEVIIDQPFLRLPVTVRFPLTPWATSEFRKGGLYRSGDDGPADEEKPEDALQKLLE
ncbi:MAG TPA: ATP-binding protein [Atribacteraceae bacterium]|nr:ATP-binding protein [Atribacteraceae bacterium]